MPLSELPHRRLAVFLAALLVTMLAARALARDEPTPIEVLNGDDIRELIALLENETFRDMDYMDLRNDAVLAFRTLVRDSGDTLRDTAIAQIRAGSRAERKRAQLVLAQLESIPTEALQPLLAHPDPEVWIWAHVVDRRRNRRHNGMQSKDRVELEETTRAFASTPARLPDDTALIGIADVLREKIGPPRLDEDERHDPELGRQARVEWQVMLEEPWRFIPRARRRFVDLDGDGVDEVVVAAVRAWGDFDTHYRCDDLSFIAVIARDAEGGWRLAHYEKVEFYDIYRDLIVADLDQDGRAECVLRNQVVAGWSYGEARVISANGIQKPIRGSFPDQTVSLVRRTGTDEVFFLTAEGYKTTHSGKAAWLCGTLAYEYRIHAMRDGALAQVGAVYVD